MLRRKCCRTLWIHSGFYYVLFSTADCIFSVLCFPEWHKEEFNSHAVCSFSFHKQSDLLRRTCNCRLLFVHANTMLDTEFTKLHNPTTFIHTLLVSLTNVFRPVCSCLQSRVLIHLINCFLPYIINPLQHFWLNCLVSNSKSLKTVHYHD
jgi:hypothetical protein